jgi:hypothetical protein
MTSSLKDDLFGLRSKLQLLEKELDAVKYSSGTTVVKKEVKKFENTEEKLAELLEKDKVIRLDIGGKIFITKISTLKQYQNSILYKAIEEDPHSGEYFFDRSYTHFSKILKYIRDNKVSFKNIKKYERDDIKAEIEFYGLTEDFQIANKKNEIDIGWDMGLSKQGALTILTDDPKTIRLHGTSCYTHYVTNKLWTNENFSIEIESKTTQNDDYYYIGLVNDSYTYVSNCMCCTPANAFYLQCNGSFKMNSVSTLQPEFEFRNKEVTIGMRVYLDEGSQKQLYFYIPDKAEAGPFTITGNNFRVVLGSCNAGTGTATISTCIEI